MMKRSQETSKPYAVEYNLRSDPNAMMKRSQETSEPYAVKYNLRKNNNTPMSFKNKLKFFGGPASRPTASRKNRKASRKNRKASRKNRR